LLPFLAVAAAAHLEQLAGLGRQAVVVALAPGALLMAGLEHQAKATLAASVKGQAAQSLAAVAAAVIRRLALIQTPARKRLATVAQGLRLQFQGAPLFTVQAVAAVHMLLAAGLLELVEQTQAMARQQQRRQEQVERLIVVVVVVVVLAGMGLAVMAALAL
jgi:nitrogen-specific signal transduction histidine kinase